ncbi:MFS transporter [Mesorhizobium sp. L-8-10]|uniref:MFS transporter n=1 Tax=Mesorhizobium sp. L-8-10 TaxID=2744523 RepID=UPI001926ECD9|nr:MFS transporter [Mesorhizobium sp. L-8-10]
MNKTPKNELPAGPSWKGTEGMSRNWVIAICFVIVLLDGLDTTSIAFVAPVLAREWGIAAAAFTPAFIATSIGAVIGYLACGPLAQRFGSRTIGVGSVVIFGLGTLLTAVAYDIVSLSILRLVSAIGLGGVLPIAVAAAAQVAAPQHKETVAMLVATGLSAGGVVGGLVGGPLMQSFGWTSVFIMGGILPLVLVPAFSHVVAGSGLENVVATKKGGRASPVAALFRDGLLPFTALLWLFAFFTFLAAFALSFWIPTLLVSFGFEPANTPIGAAAFGAGGVAGNLVMMTIVSRLGMKRVLLAAMLLAIVCVALIGKAPIPAGMVLPLIAGVGAGLITGCVGQSALAVSLYPPALRATGVGYAAACGRLGSILGPALGGAMLSFGWSARDIILTTILPALLAMLTVTVLGLVERNRRPMLNPG